MKKQLLVILSLLCALGLVAQTITAPQGSGTEADPYQISSYENLNWLTSRDEASEVPFLERLGANYIQTNDIEFPAEASEWNEGLGFLPIGYGTLSESFPFSGIYNGNGFTISNLYINRPLEDSVALFSLLITGTIEDLGLVNVEVVGSWGAAGLVGEMDTNSIVNNCFVTGNIVGEVFVGGITGYNFESAITNTYFIGSIEGLEASGGIAGVNDVATISNSYAVATIEEGDYAGTLVGMNDGSTLQNSFWDSELTTALPSTGDESGTIENTLGKTTVEMKTEATFTDAGWDFTETWQINDQVNDSYPSFIWQSASTEPEPNYPPTNLTGTANGSSIELNWEAPLDLSAGLWLTKGAEENNDGIGTGSAAVISVSQMYTEAELAMYQGMYINSMKIFPREATASYTLKVWGGADGNTELYSQAITNFTNEAWNEYALDSSVAIPVSGPLYIGYVADTPTGYPAGSDAGPAVTGGDMIKLGDQATWDVLSEIVTTININWNIQAFVSPEGESRVAASPLVKVSQTIKTNNKINNDQILAGNLNPITSNRINSVEREVTAYKIYRDDEEIAEVASTIFTYTDTDLANGTYNYYITAVYDTDESPSSNSVNIVVNVSVPGDYLIEDSFETYTDFALEAGPWNLVDGDLSGTYSITDTSWENAEAPQAYIVFNPSTTTPPLSGDYDAYDGSKYMVAFASTTPDNNDWMMTQEFTLGDTGTFNFWAKSITDAYGLERFSVLVSDGSTNPNDFTSISGATYTEASLAWTQYSYSLDAYANQTIRVAIQCVSSDAFMFMVDQVQVEANGGTDNDINDIAVISQLKGNYPNPFNPETRIAFSTIENGPVSIDIFNIKGQKVRTLLNENRQSGDHSVVWNGKDDAGKNLASGVFFYRMKSGKFSSTKKMILMK